MKDDEPDDAPMDLHEIVAGYADRLNAGEKIEPEEILAEHPTLCGEVLDQLQAFVSLRPPAGPDGILATLGDYTLRRQIGRGGMGVVYEAWENSIGRTVALKVLPAGIATDTRASARFLREAQAAGRLNHPNVVSVYAMGVREQTPYYAMEFVEGETLAQILVRLRAAEGKEEEKRGIEQGISGLLGKGRKATPAVEPDVAEEASGSTDKKLPFGGDDFDLRYYASLAHAFAGVAEGLQHAHSKGIIHRDIKPSNLILDREGRLRILDFGLARLEGQESLTRSGDFLGTPLYMSPEQAKRRKIPIDHRTDIYSLGATMYEVLTCRPPFQGKDDRDTLSQIISRDVQPPRHLNPRIPKDLETIVLKCLEKDPGDRYGTAEALGHDLRRFIRGDLIEARPRPPWQHAARKLWRARRKVCFAAVLLSLLFTLLLLLRGHYEKTQKSSQCYHRLKPVA